MNLLHFIFHLYYFFFNTYIYIMCVTLVQYVGFLLISKLDHIIKCKKLISIVFLFNLFVVTMNISFSSYGHLIAEAKFLISSFLSCTFSHIHRHGNSIAHNLGKHTSHVSGLMVWMEDILPHIYYSCSLGQFWLVCVLFQ